MNTLQIPLNSLDSTDHWGKIIGDLIQPGLVVALEGNLGAGKTHLVKSIVAGLGCDPSTVTSPTFMLMNVYQGRLPIHHFDTYRLKSAEEFLDFGGEEALYSGGVSLVEWPLLVAQYFPVDHLWIKLETTGEFSRLMTLTGHGELSNIVVNQLREMFNPHRP
jgi:tRNA threonylcarbamoyladenosine biosynthesis protein TsaE